MADPDDGGARSARPQACDDVVEVGEHDLAPIVLFTLRDRRFPVAEEIDCGAGVLASDEFDRWLPHRRIGVDTVNPEHDCLGIVGVWSGQNGVEFVCHGWSFPKGSGAAVVAG